MKATFATLALFASIGTARAFDREEVLAVVASVNSLQRAAAICPQYDFSAHEKDFARIIANARSEIGDAAVDEKIHRWSTNL